VVPAAAAVIARAISDIWSVLFPKRDSKWKRSIATQNTDITVQKIGVRGDGGFRSCSGGVSYSNRITECR